MGNNVWMDDPAEHHSHDLDPVLTQMMELQTRGMPSPFPSLSPFGLPQSQPPGFGAFGGGMFPRDPHAQPMQPGNLQE